MAAYLFAKFFLDYLEKKEDEQEELWQPYFDELAIQTIKAAKRSDTVVLTYATYQQALCDYEIEKLIECGVLDKNIFIIHLSIDSEVKLKGLCYRTKLESEADGKTIIDVMKAS